MSEPRRLPYLKNRIINQVEQTTQPPQQTPPVQTQTQFPQQEPQVTQPNNNPKYQEVKQQVETPTQNQPPASTGARSAVPRKQSRIDTELIPRPSLKAEDSVIYQIFKTTPVPLYHTPMSLNYYITEDDGNVGPRYLRSSVYALGNDPSITNQTEIPLGVVVQPLADPGTYEEAPPLIEYISDPIRCGRCKSYMNPFMQFTDNGNNYTCNICRFVNKTPSEYYAPLGASNTRTDKYERQELFKGCYDIVAPKEYIKKPIENMMIMFCIEFTQQTVQMGVYLQIIQSLQAILDSVQCPERTEVAFVTFDQRMHFYNIPANLSSEPQLVIVSELDEDNIPLPREKIFMNVANEKEKIQYLLEKLTKQAEQVKQASIGVPLLAMMNNAALLMAPRTGRILVFTHQFPTIGMGKLSQRKVDPKVFGTDQEKALYVPQDQAYVNLGNFCLKNHISLDLWLFNEHGHDLASISPIPSITFGSIYYYPNYDPIVNGEELHYALFRNLTRNVAFDCIMTLRLSNGLTLNEYITGAGKLSVRDLELPFVDADKTISIYYKHEDKINEPEAYMQYAILFSNVWGQRLIRVMNLQLQVVNKLNNNNPWHSIFKTSDVDATHALLLRRALANITTVHLKQIRSNLFSQLVSILHAYRRYCSSTSPHGQLILPETIKTIPVLLQGSYKRDLLRQGTVKLDSRMYDIYLMLTQPMNFINNYLYPKVYAIHYLRETLVQDMYRLGAIIEDQKVVMPNTIPTSSEKLASEGIYLIDTNAFIFVYVMRDVDRELLQELFQIDSADAILSNQIEQLANNPDSDVNQRVHNMIDQLRRNKNGSYQPIKIVVHNTTAAAYVQTWLVEDEQRQEKAYGDFLCDIHSSIQAKGL